MIYIVKKHEPRELTEYRESESSTGVRPTYDSMSSDLHEYVLSKLVEEQGGLCAYCMCRIPESDKKTGSTLKCTIEHTRFPSTPFPPPVLSARSCAPPKRAVRALCPARGTCLTEWSSCVPATRRPFSGHPANAARAYRSAASGDTAQGAGF